MSDLASQTEGSVLVDHVFKESVFEGEVSDDISLKDRGIIEEALEPDEHTLSAALRNQDDIPILMDIVLDKLTASMSQESQLADALEHQRSAAAISLPEDSAQVDDITPAVTVEEPKYDEHRSESVSVDPINDEGDEFTRAQITKAVSIVLAKRLPELVQEVLNTMSESSASE